MSEGPEIHRIARSLNEEIAGSRIVGVESRLKKAHAWLEAHEGIVQGREIERVRAAGKNLIWDIKGGLYFHIHLLMFGKLRTFTLRHRVEWERTTRALIVTTARQVVLTNVQVFNIGVGDPFEQIDALREIGPDMCVTPFDSELFLQRLNLPVHQDEEIGPVLLLQSVAAGVGNFLKSDILFECGINPWTRVRELTALEQQCLAEIIPVIAERTMRNRGQTVTDEVLEQVQASQGERMRWVDKHWVFRQSIRPCKICGTPIRQKRQGPGTGRVTFYCPQCQGVATG